MALRMLIENGQTVANAGERSIALIGFGEAAQALVQGWGGTRPGAIRAYDIKSDSIEMRRDLLKSYRRHDVAGCNSMDEAVANADIVISLVDAAQAFPAARAAAPNLRAATWYFDLNSTSPASKVAAAQAVESFGGRYVDVAVMAPLHPLLLKVPLLVSGPHVAEGVALLAELGLTARGVGTSIGTASTIKIIRSVYIKGCEALAVECLLAASVAGVEDEIIDSLPSARGCEGVEARLAYSLERMLRHGMRRSLEMWESSRTLADLGVDNRMAIATAAWQAAIGDLGLRPAADIKATLAAIRTALARHR